MQNKKQPPIKEIMFIIHVYYQCFMSVFMHAYNYSYMHNDIIILEDLSIHII